MANVEHNTRDTTSLHPFARRSESDPGAIGAGKGWFKLSTGELKVRNAADNGWVTVIDPNLATHLADSSDAHDASAISITDTGAYYTATDVEAALQEIGAGGIGGGGGGDADTLEGHAAAYFATATGLSDHLSDATDAHDASAISVLDTATQYTATNVEDALAEVLDGLQAHEADTTDAHDASAISFSPTGTIAATNVQTAIAEVASEASGTAIVPAWIDQTGSNSLFAAWGDGNPSVMDPYWNSSTGVTISGTNLTTTVIRLVKFRLPKALAVAHVRAYSEGSTTGIFTLGIYRVSDSVRMWNPGAVNTAATSWNDYTADTPFSLAANTDYYAAIGATATSATATFRCIQPPSATSVYGADAAPLGGRSIGIAVRGQTSTTSGAMPSPLGTVAGTSGQIPVLFLEGTAS